MLFSAFALVAVVLAAMGLYGVISYQVTRRTREIGVRMALATVRFVRGMLYGIAPTDPVTFGSVAALLLAVAIAAALVPATKASGIQPVEALRAD
jgi:putative ABC transport system permease protein